MTTTPEQTTGINLLITSDIGMIVQTDKKEIKHTNQGMTVEIEEGTDKQDMKIIGMITEEDLLTQIDL